MIRFVIWATLKDFIGWRPTEVIGSITGDYTRWKRMKAVYEKDWSSGALLKEGFEKGQKKQPQKKEMDIQIEVFVNHKREEAE